MNTYTPTIGLEVHAELNTKSKMFCGCRNNPHCETPNCYICPICMGHPGTLPVPNKSAIAKLLTFGYAVNGRVADFTEFDRKNYFYPDIPKAYQISQYAFPLVSGGEINGVILTRVHLEEDTARSQHQQGTGSLVNYNRAGVPLLELVTEPVIHDAETAGSFARELQLLLRTLSISNANMEKGEMRVEANISVSKNDNLGTKVEVKNLNSFRSVESAIKYEIKRQKSIYDSGLEVKQETRGWDENKQATFSQRSKETAKDYRYFPDPDIPKLSIAKYPEFSEKNLLLDIPELPAKKREKYSDIGLPRQQIETILQHEYIDMFFRVMVENYREEPDIIKSTANYLTSDVISILTEKDSYPDDVYHESMYVLLKMLKNDQITSRTAKDLLPEVLYDGIDPVLVTKKRNLLQSSNEQELKQLVLEVIKDHQDVVSEYRNGKNSSIQFLVGQGMKKSKGSANPKLLFILLKKELDT